MPPPATTTSAKQTGDEPNFTENGTTSEKNPSVSISFLNKIEKVVVHPLVLLSVVDQLSSPIDFFLHFLVPFDGEEKEKDVWFLDHEYLENMYTMFWKVNVSPTN